jgi:ribosome-binding factor A
MPKENFRTDRISEEVRREIDRIIREEISDPRVGGTFSVTRADVTRDLRYAKVYVSILEEDRRAPMMAALKKAAGFVRFHLGKRMDLRYTPEVLFTLDTNIEYGVHIASMINQVIQEERKPEDADS